MPIICGQVCLTDNDGEFTVCFVHHICSCCRKEGGRKMAHIDKTILCDICVTNFNSALSRFVMRGGQYETKV